MKYIEIAKAVKPQGIKGEIKLAHYCDSPEDFCNFETLYIKKAGSYNPVKIEKIRTDHKSVYVMLDIIKTRNDAEGIRGTIFYADKADLASMPEDSFMMRDLIGVAVYDEDDNKMGVLKEILQHGAADVYVVKSDNTGFMFPALKRVIKSIDIEKKSMILDKSALAEVAVYED